MAHKKHSDARERGTPNTLRSVKDRYGRTNGARTGARRRITALDLYQARFIVIEGYSSSCSTLGYQVVRGSVIVTPRNLGSICASP
jgi:hypothetical protein